MQRISIERYRTPDLCEIVTPPEGYARIERIEDHFAGLIEGTRDDGSRWIMYIDAKGSPLIFWGEREEDGAVIGEGIPLQNTAVSYSMEGTVTLAHYPHDESVLNTET